MLISTVILGWTGILLFFITGVSFQKMAKNNEFAFMHFLMALMYALWLPLPITLNESLNSDYLVRWHLFWGGVFTYVSHRHDPSDGPYNIHSKT